MFDGEPLKYYDFINQNKNLDIQGLIDKFLNSGLSLWLMSPWKYEREGGKN
jgi:hypothetical protein